MLGLQAYWHPVQGISQSSTGMSEKIQTALLTELHHTLRKCVGLNGPKTSNLLHLEEMTTNCTSGIHDLRFQCQNSATIMQLSKPSPGVHTFMACWLLVVDRLTEPFDSGTPSQTLKLTASIRDLKCVISYFQQQQTSL